MGISFLLSLLFIIKCSDDQAQQVSPGSVPLDVIHWDIRRLLVILSPPLSLFVVFYCFLLAMTSIFNTRAVSLLLAAVNESSFRVSESPSFLTTQLLLLQSTCVFDLAMWEYTSVQRSFWTLLKEFTWLMCFKRVLKENDCVYLMHGRRNS